MRRSAFGIIAMLCALCFGVHSQNSDKIVNVSTSDGIFELRVSLIDGEYDSILISYYVFNSSHDQVMIFRDKWQIEILNVPESKISIHNDVNNSDGKVNFYCLGPRKSYTTSFKSKPLQDVTIDNSYLSINYSEITIDTLNYIGIERYTFNNRCKYITLSNFERKQ